MGAELQIALAYLRVTPVGQLPASRGPVALHLRLNPFALGRIRLKLGF